TAGSMVRPSSDMPDMKLPGRTLNSTKTTAMTANSVGTMLARRRARTRSINCSSYTPPKLSSLCGRRSVHPDVLVVLVGDLGGIGLQTMQPRLIGHHRLVVVEEPHWCLFVEQVVGLADQVDLLVRIVGLRGIIEKLVEGGVVERHVVAGGARCLGIEAA